jgi:putative inorganic carbon (hco3(-)) transporter
VIAYLRSKRLLLTMCCLYFFVAVTVPNSIKLFTKASLADVLLFVILIYYLFITMFFRESGFKVLFFKIYDFLRQPLFLSMTLLFIVMAASASYASNKAIAVTESIRFLTYLIFGFLIHSEFSEEKEIKAFIYTFTTSVLCVNLIGIYQFITKKGIRVNVDINGTTGRIESTFGNPNGFGAFLVLALFPCILILLSTKNKRKKFICLLLCLLCFINLMLSLSRNSWLAFAIGLLILIFTYNWRLIYAALALGAGAMFIPTISTRVKQFTDFSQNQGRIKIWSIASKMIGDHPLRGVGNGNFSVLYDSYVEKYPEYWEQFVSSYPTHNSYLKIQSELGIVGTVPFLSSIFFSISNIVHSLKTYTGMVKCFYSGFLISAICMLILNFFDNILFVPQVAVVFWVFIFICSNTKQVKD